MSGGPDRIRLLQTFIRIVECGSITAAANDLSTTPATVSRHLKALEAELGLTLVHRNTHTSTLTSAGEELMVSAREVVTAWQRMLDTNGALGAAEAVLSIVAPIAYGQEIVGPLLVEFLRNRPSVRMSLKLVNGPIDFQARGCDLWICLGPVANDALVVRTVGAVESVVVASPAFVEKFVDDPTGPPEDGMDYVALEPYWSGVAELVEEDGEGTVRTTPKTRVSTDNLYAVRSLVVGGLGYSILPEFLIREELKAGKLVRIAERWRGKRVEVNTAYAPDRYRGATLVAFIERLHDGLATT